jgi:hypothetical protein
MNPDQATPTDAPAMSASALAAERRRGRIAGIATIATILLLVSGAVWSGKIDQDDTGGKPVVTQQRPAAIPHAANDVKAKQKAADDLKDDRDEVNGMASIDNHSGPFLGAALLLSLALALLSLPAHALYRATRARSPGEPSIIGFAAIYGPIALGLGTLIRALALKHASADFVDQQFTTFAAAADEARDSQQGAAFFLYQGLWVSGALAFVFWLIKGVWDAQKVGLLPKTFAVLGMALPLLMLIATPIAPPIALFWILALGLLLLRRWPGRIPPAWEEGRSIPWPTRAKIPDAATEPEVGGERNGEVKAVGPGVNQAEADDGADQSGEPAGQPPRKRKRRN